MENALQLPDRPEGDSPGRGGPSDDRRPWWMTAMAFVCLVALLVNIPRDLFFAETREVEVWLGFEIRGWAAILTAPLHWVIFGIGAWAFWSRRTWVVPWAAAYLFYVGLSHIVWSEVNPDGRGWPTGVVQALVHSVFGLLLLRARRGLEPWAAGPGVAAPVPPDH